MNCGRFPTTERIFTSLQYAGGPLAQLVEQGTLNPKVEGSNPSRPISESPYAFSASSAEAGSGQGAKHNVTNPGIRLSLVPAGGGNTRALKHGAYSQRMTLGPSGRA